MAQRGFPGNRESILDSVQKFLKDNPRKHPFNDNRQGNGWFKAFLRRHSDIISSRTSEGVSSASSCVSEKDIRKWFSGIDEYINEKNLEDILKDPSRVYNGDETGFQICPSTGKVYAEKRAKNVYHIEHSSSKENITVMFTFAADGKKCCPMVVFPQKRIPEKLARSVNASWGIGRSEKGWMTTECKM